MKSKLRFATLRKAVGRFFRGASYPSHHTIAWFATVLALPAFFGGGALLAQTGSSQTGDRAEVQSDALTVYSGMSTTSSVVRSLRKGDHVSIRLQVSGAEGSWCKIAESGETNSLGYVLCSQLKRVSQPRAQGTGSTTAHVPVIYGSTDSPRTDPSRADNLIASFDRGSVRVEQRDPNIDYSLDPSAERFFVHVPPGYSEQMRYGLVVFIDSGDRVEEMPAGWAAVLDARHLLFIAPQNAGNHQGTARRLGLGVLAASEMLKHYHIDRERIYISGYSGGARIAELLGFFQSDLFRGTIQNCGAEFYQHVPQVYATSQVDAEGVPFLFPATEREIHGARRVRFALITGTEDFRRGNILDIYNGGFAKAGFQARLFDVPGMGHDTADATTLNAVLGFLEASH
jgi:hypothetical protein